MRGGARRAYIAFNMVRVSSKLIRRAFPGAIPEYWLNTMCDTFLKMHKTIPGPYSHLDVYSYCMRCFHIDFEIFDENDPMTFLNAISRRIDITKNIPPGHTYIAAVAAARATLSVMDHNRVARGLLRRSRRYPPSTTGILILNCDAISAFAAIANRHVDRTSAIAHLWQALCVSITRDGLPWSSAQDSAQLIVFWLGLAERVDSISERAAKIIMRSNPNFPAHMDHASLGKLIPRVAEMLLQEDFCEIAGAVLARCSTALSARQELSPAHPTNHP